MIKVGITGQTGFVGQHLYNTLGLFLEEFERIDFNKDYFNNEGDLKIFVSRCDVIVHLAAMNRHLEAELIYKTNLILVQKIVAALEASNSKAHLLFSSSSQEENDNLYGKSKKDGREILKNWAIKNGAPFTGLVIPNVFGPFGHPYYNSFIATFSHQLTHNEKPKIEVDGEVKLIYVTDLVTIILNKIRNKGDNHLFNVTHTSENKVSEVLNLLEGYKNLYFDSGIIPALNTPFELNLFNTFRSFININNHNPVKLVQNADLRGSFVEIIRLNAGGQVSFSTTKPGITRGNHFHTRKIERFAVIKGKALVQLRKIGTDEVFNFYLDGQYPSYVDMPIWFTHNIKNIGDEELFTTFWINEFYDIEDPDTYLEEV